MSAANKSDKHMKRNFFLLTSSLLMAFFVIGCASNRENTLDYSCKTELEAIRKQVVFLAVKVGIPSARAEKCSTKELLVDIEMRLNENHGYEGRYLTDDDMRILSSYLNNKTQTMQTIKEYHNYLRVMQQKQIVVLPESRL